MARKKSDDDGAGPRPQPEGCAWKTGFSIRCRLPWTLSFSGSGKRLGYCVWHAMCLEDQRLMDSFEVFEEWHQRLGPRYCDLWAHYPAAWLWAMLNGDTPEPKFPEPCARASCRYRPALPEPSRVEIVAMRRELDRRIAEIAENKIDRVEDDGQRRGTARFRQQELGAPALQEKKD